MSNISLGEPVLNLSDLPILAVKSIFLTYVSIRFLKDSIGIQFSDYFNTGLHDFSTKHPKDKLALSSVLYPRILIESWVEGKTRRKNK